MATKIKSQDILLSYITVKNFYKDIIKQEKTPIAKYEILLVLSQNKDLRVGELSNKIKITRPNLTPLIDDLATKGFLSKKQDTKDKRATIINITKKGLNELDKNLNVIDERLKKINESLTENQIETLTKDLTEILSIIG